MSKCELTVTNWQRLFTAADGLVTVTETLLECIDSGERIQSSQATGLAVAAISLSKHMVDIIGAMDSSGMERCLLQDRGLKRIPPKPSKEVLDLFEAVWHSVIRRMEAKEEAA